MKIGGFLLLFAPYLIKNTKTVNRSKIWLADGLVDASNLELIQGMAQGWEVV